MTKRNTFLSILGGIGAALSVLFGVRHTSTPAPPTTLTMPITVWTVDHQRIPDLVCTLTVETQPPQPPVACTYRGDDAVFVLPIGTLGWSARLDLSAPHFTSLSESVTVTTARSGRELVARAARLFPAEHGPLTVDGAYFKDERGQVWDWRGATMFLLPCRWMRGEDISPQIVWMQRHGVNVARVFISGVGGFNETCGRPWERYADFPVKVRGFNEVLAAAGIRVENTVVTDDDVSAEVYHGVLQSVYDALEGQWNAFVEPVNEPWVANRQTVLDRMFALGINRHGLLSAYGTQPPSDNACQCYLPIPTLDYVTPHSDRDLEHFAQNPKELLERRDVLHKPIVDDEPLGFADFDRNGGGARTTNKAYVVTHFAVCRLFGAGCTAHAEALLYGLAPDPVSITESIMDGISAVWAFIPGDAQTGTYLAPHIPAFPLVWAGTDSEVHHAYAKPLGNRAFAVNIRPTPGWTAQGTNGWTVKQTLTDYPYIVELQR